MKSTNNLSDIRRSERGNLLFIILIAIVLIGALTVAVQNGGSDNRDIDDEELAIRATEFQRYASELERGILYIMQNGVSESDIRFAHSQAHADYGDLSADADPSDQMFHPRGGGAQYRAPPNDINDGSAWEFYGQTHLPGVGSERADLIAVVPNVTDAFCNKINALNNQTGTPDDLTTCLASDAGRVDDTTQFNDSTTNTVDETSFEQDPETTAARTAAQACVICVDTNNYAYHVILAR